MELHWPHNNQHTEFPGGTSKTLCSKIFNLQLQKNIYTRKFSPKIIFTMQQNKRASYVNNQQINRVKFNFEVNIIQLLNKQILVNP